MSDPTTHRGWCVQENCSPAEHRGRVVEIRAEDGTGFDHLTIQVVQPSGAAEPYFSITGRCAEAAISIEQGREVGFVLTRQARRVERFA